MAPSRTIFWAISSFSVLVRIFSVSLVSIRFWIFWSLSLWTLRSRIFLRNFFVSPFSISAFFSSGSPTKTTSNTLTMPFLAWSPKAFISLMVTEQLATAEITSFCPASIFLAMVTSPSRVRSEMVPISLRYMRTGSSIDTLSLLAGEDTSSEGSVSFSLEPLALLEISFSPFEAESTIWISFSPNRCIKSSICSGAITSEGSTSFTSS